MNMIERKWGKKIKNCSLAWLTFWPWRWQQQVLEFNIYSKATLHHIPVDCRTSHLRFHNLHSLQNVIRMLKSNTTISFKRGTLLHRVSNLVPILPFCTILLLTLCGYEAWVPTFRKEHKLSFWEWGSEMNVYLKGRKLQQDRENCIMRSFIICALHHTGNTCSLHGSEVHTKLW
jgi:hypothetical protein